MTITLLFNSRKNIDKKKHRQTKLYDRQMPIYRNVPRNIK